MEKTESWSLVRMAYATLAGVTLALGILGLFLPLLPTTVFVLIAAWAAPKGSPRLHRWIWRHPKIGPVLHAWYSRGAVPRPAKWLACLSMIFSWICLLLIGMNTLVLSLVALLFLAVATFLITRPDN